MKLVLIKRSRSSAKWLLTNVFFVEDSVDDVEQLLRQAAQAFLETPIGQKALIQSVNAFNWGSAFSCIPVDYWREFGLHVQEKSKEYTIRGQTVVIHLNHDEVLNK